MSAQCLYACAAEVKFDDPDNKRVATPPQGGGGAADVAACADVVATPPQGGGGDIERISIPFLDDDGKQGGEDGQAQKGVSG